MSRSSPTPLAARRQELVDLQRSFLGKQRSARPAGAGMELLGGPLLQSFDQTLARRQGKIAGLTDLWLRLVPETLSGYCTLRSFVRGTLTVAVDGGPPLFELKQLLLAGLQQQILLAGGPLGLRKIVLRAASGDDGETPSPKPKPAAIKRQSNSGRRQPPPMSYH